MSTHRCNWYCRDYIHCDVISAHGPWTADELLEHLRLYAIETNMSPVAVVPTGEPPTIDYTDRSWLDKTGQIGTTQYLPVSTWWRIHFSWTDELHAPAEGAS